MPQPRPRKLLGVLWILGAVAVPILALAFSLAIAAEIGLFSNLFVIFTLPVSIFMAKRGRRHFAKVGERYLERDPRAPVVFLREFGEEQSILDDTSESSGATFEQRLVDTFEILGPVVAIGQPGESLPPSGSIRLYVDDEHWQAKVAELIERSSLIVIQARGRSQGMFWELDHVFKRNPFKRTMLAFPFQHVFSPRERYVDFRESFEKMTGIKLPYETSEYIYFESPDTPIPMPMPELVVARLAPEAFQKHLLRVARMQMIFQLSLAMLGVFLLLVTVKTGGYLRFGCAVLSAIYGSGVLSFAALRKNWGIPFVLALVAFYAVIAYALAADRLPGVSGSDIFFLWGATLLFPFLLVIARIWVLCRKQRKNEGDDGAVVARNSKSWIGNFLKFALVPIAALAAWLSVLAFAQAFPVPAHLTESQLLQLAAIQREIYAVANEPQCERMVQGSISRQGSIHIEDILDTLGTQLDGYRSTQKVVRTLPKDDAETYFALRESALSQEAANEIGPSAADVFNDTAQILSNPDEKMRFDAAWDPLTGKTTAPPDFDSSEAFCTIVQTVTRHYPELPKTDVTAFTRFLGF